jgi:hypothetical protein
VLHFVHFFSVDGPSFLFGFGCRMSCSLLSLSTVLSQSCGGIFVVSVFASPPIAATIQFSGVTNGCEIYGALRHLRYSSDWS